MPHCTLAQGLGTDEMAEAFQLLHGYQPIAAQVTSAGSTDVRDRSGHPADHLIVRLWNPRWSARAGQSQSRGPGPVPSASPAGPIKGSTVVHGTVMGCAGSSALSMPTRATGS